jgi:outer membrane autotransporter protein
MAGRIISRSSRVSRSGVETPPDRRAGFYTSTSRLALVALFGAGASLLAVPAWAANFNVSSASQLNDAINRAANGDTITFTSDITLGSSLPSITKNITILGNGKTLSGGNLNRGFVIGDPFNASVKPTVAINNLTIANTLAKGGDGAMGELRGGGAGGGGAGLGSALLVLAGANLTVTNVALLNGKAQGGNGGRLYATGGHFDPRLAGGGGGGYFSDGKLGVTGGFPLGYGGHGGLPGGGDGGNNRSGSSARPGGFGGGGGGQGMFRNMPGGAGGFGGGGGGSGYGSPVANAKGGFGGADANGQYGGGGAGLGGAIFVQQGGTLTLGGSLNISGNAVQGGSTANGATAKAFGSGFFLQGNGSLALAPGAGQTQTIADVIADQTGVGGTGANAGSWQLVKNGAGTTILTGANAYTGGTTINAGTLQGNTTSLVGNFTDNASLVFDQGADGSFAGAVSGSGGLTKAGAAALTLTGRNTYSGGTFVTAGLLLLNGSSGLPGAVTLNGGMIGVSGGGTTVANNPISIGPASGSGVYAAAGANLSLSGVVSGGQLTKSGAGDVTLTGANTFTGAEITSGVLRFNTAANLGAPGDIVINGGSVGSTSATPAGTAINRSLVLLGAGGVDVGNNALTWSGPIAGAGQFVKSGAGSLTLTGVNTYAGGTKVTNGALIIGSDAVLGEAGTGVTLMGSGSLRATETFATSRPFLLTNFIRINVDDTKQLTLNGIISGSVLAKDGPGTLVLNGANTYSGTDIDNGQLVGNSTSIRGDIFASSNTSVRFEQATTGTFGGDITGRGAVIKTNVGQLTLTGKNDYSGGTFIFLGTLQGTSDSLQGDIVNDSRIVFNQDFDGTFGGNLSQEDGIGTLIKAGVGNLAMTGTSFTTVTNVNGGTLTVDGSLGSPVTAVNDGGTLVVNGRMTSDAVSVNSGGSMAVNGNLTSPLVTISPDGELQGHGNIVGDVDDKGGEIAPGNSIGTLHISGPLEMEPHSEYQVQINGASSDEIEVSQTAKIESSTFEVERYNTAASPVLPGKTYTILTTGGGLTVAEPTVAIADFPFINFTLTEDAFNGYLTTSRSAERFAELASTPNEAAVANALDSATSSLAWQQVVGASTADARAAFSSLSNASIHASAAGVLSEQSHFLRDAVLDRLRQDFPVGPAADPDSVLSYAEAVPATPAVAALPTRKAPVVAPLGPVYAVWAQGLGGWGSLGGNSNVTRTNDSIGGVISGIDVTFNRMFRLGFAGGYSQSNFNSVNIPASGSADSYHFAVYGGWQDGPWALRGGGSVSWNDLNTSRQVTAVALGGQQTSSYADKTWQGFVEGARNFAFGQASLEPFANVAYVHVGGDVSESGLAAMSGSTSFDTTYTTLGAHGSYVLPAGLTAQATLGWRYAFGDVTPFSTLAFQSGGNAFALAGSPIARNALVTELGVNYAIGPSATLGVTYSGQYAGGANENAGKATLTVRF